MVKPGRLVAGKALGVAGAVVAVLAVAYIFRKSEAGTALLESLRGAGTVAGQSILAPIEGLLKGVSAGTGSIVQESTKIGANLASFGEAIAAGDFQSIIDGSYIAKYGAPGDQSKIKTDSTGSAATRQTFEKSTIRDETSNDKSTIKQNFAAQPVTIFNIEDILKRKTQSTAISNLQSNLNAQRASIAARKGTINIGSSTGVNFNTAAQALIARLRG